MDKAMRNHDEHKILTIQQPEGSVPATRHRACRPDHSTSKPGPESSLFTNLCTLVRQAPALRLGASMPQQTRISQPPYAGLSLPITESRCWFPKLKGLLSFLAIVGLL